MTQLNFSSRGRLPLVRQTEAAECGLACLAMVASFHGHRVDLNTLRRRYPVSLNGVTLRALIQVASQLHLVGRPLRFELENLRQLRLPAILHWDMSHFVVLKSVRRQGITIHDPASGEKYLPLAEASKHLTGVALELSPTEAFVRQDERARLPFSVFWRQLSGSGHALVQIFVLSVILQLLVLAAPFYMQITVDEVIARGDVDLLVVLAAGFRAPRNRAGRHLRAALAHPADRAERGAVSARRASVPASHPAADVVLREAAHRRHPVPLHLPRSRSGTSSPKA